MRTSLIKKYNTDGGFSQYLEGNGKVGGQVLLTRETGHFRETPSS